jgi:hypothetical protein
LRLRSDSCFHLTVFIQQFSRNSFHTTVSGIAASSPTAGLIATGSRLLRPAPTKGATIMSGMTLQLNRFESADIRREPFPFLVTSGALAEAARPALAADFPRYKEAGYFPFTAEECGPAVQQLVAEITSPEIANALGARLGIDNLAQYPTLVTICRMLNRRHGTIHTDSKSKVATALIYLNDQWNGNSDGCLRFLAANDDIDKVLVPEIAPLYGNMVMFKRSENSFHGHLPYEGERRVIQIAWVTSQAEIDRKTRRGRFSRLMKSLFGGIDRRMGAGRDRNAAHLD